MTDKSGRGLMMAGAILSFIGVCVVLVKVLGVPGYWTPLMVGAGLFLFGLVRWITSRD